MKKDYLTKKQYLDLLVRIRARLDTISKIEAEDCTDWGIKHTKCNVGLCNEDMTTKEIALFPDYFPKLRLMKYRKNKQGCPLDSRTYRQLNRYGCFYTCRAFHSSGLSLDMVKRLYDEHILKINPINNA